MDPISFSISALTAFKELYLISRFIYRTVSSAKNGKTERQDLREEFHIEILYLQSFGQLLLQNNGVLEQGSLNEAWLWEIHFIFEKLRLRCGDYAKLAATQDKDYQTYSPYLNSAMAASRVIEFSFDIKSDVTTGMQLLEPAKSKKSVFGWFSTKTSNDSYSWKWALFERRKFESILREFQKWTGKLKELVPLTLGLHPRYSNTQVLEMLVKNEDSNRLGLAPHARLRQLTIEPSIDHRDFYLENVALDARMDAQGLITANLLDSSRAFPETEKVLVEFKKYGQDVDVPGTEPDPQTEQRVHQLASLLSSSGDDELHTLGFRGLIHQPKENRYAFIFNFPSSSTPPTSLAPVSLNTLISSPKPGSRLSLPQRFRVAQGIAKTVSAFHTDGWVHKSIRSHSIMFFQDMTVSAGPSLHHAYLVDFEFSRPEGAETQYTFDKYWEKDVYRHPERQGVPTIGFTKLHDIYALGVVLLEIGLWQTAMSIYEDANSKLRTGVMMSPRGIQNVFIEVAKRRLPHHMGPAYLDAVLKCLSGHFKDDVTGGNLAMSFHEQVVRKIDVRCLE